ncbi:MAG: ribokinase [Clostridia bacterium]|nr:ribokinase [Clostridia bacterium]
MKIINFGSLNLDYVYRVPHFVQPGETLQSRSRETVCGGKGLNQSVALSRSGAEVWHAGCIGEGDGEPLAAMLAEAGVHLEHLQRVAGPSGHTVIQVNDEGENCILLFAGANGQIDAAQVEETLSHFGPGDLLVLQNEVSCIGDMIRTAKARGMLVAMNPSPVGGCEAYPLEETDWLFVNEEEARAISGADAGADEEGVLAAVEARFPRTRVIATFGARGAMAVSGGRPRLWQDAFRVKPVDTTAAGDTFMGYFLGRASRGDSEADCLRMAARASSIAVTRPGAAPSIPMLEEVERA